MSSASFNALRIPFLAIVRIPRVETVRVTFWLSNSGMIYVFFWRFAYRRRFPVGLNFVARTRLEYPPPTIEPFPVISHVRAIKINKLIKIDNKSIVAYCIKNASIYNQISWFCV